ncbi:hypothetical protein ACS0TY_023468 [Phlomoides rotata]
MDLAFENLSLLEEEENEDGLVIDQCSVGGTGTSSDVELCVVGRILTEQYVNFGIMKARLASIWKSKKDIFMKERVKKLKLRDGSSVMEPIKREYSPWLKAPDRRTAPIFSNKWPRSRKWSTHVNSGSEVTEQAVDGYEENNGYK